MLVTSDGVHWAELPLPEGIEPLYVNFSGGSWLLSGVEALSVEVLSDDGEPDPDGPRIPLTEFLAQRDPPDTFAERVFFSDDEGITWTELNLDVPELSEQEWPCIEVGLPVTHPGVLRGGVRPGGRGRAMVLARVLAGLPDLAMGRAHRDRGDDHGSGQMVKTAGGDARIRGRLPGRRVGP